MRTLAKRKILQGYKFFMLAAVCLCATLLIPMIGFCNFWVLKKPIIIIIILATIVSFISFCILLIKSIRAGSDANILLRGAQLIDLQNDDELLFISEEKIIMKANTIFRKCQNNSRK